MKKKQPTIADVLHLAADKCLCAHSRYGETGHNKFSCCAVNAVLYQIYGAAYCNDEVTLFRNRILDGLNNMGCYTGSSTLFVQYGDPEVFDDINHTVQGMRYMWLKWAAMMAEEQGV